MCNPILLRDKSKKASNAKLTRRFAPNVCNGNCQSLLYFRCFAKKLFLGNRWMTISFEVLRDASLTDYKPVYNLSAKTFLLQFGVLALGLCGMVGWTPGDFKLLTPLALCVVRISALIPSVMRHTVLQYVILFAAILKFPFISITPLGF